MKPFLLKSPAKVNLYLKVLNKRPDGFHNIYTVFERIDLQDTLEFSANDSGKITIACDHPHVPCGSKNLVYKIADQLKKDFGVLKGVHIKIQKNIPVAAGLAGGSTNAATTLVGLNRLWRLNLSQKQLIKYADQVGSDVTFFLFDESWAEGKGRGNAIKPFQSSIKLWHILVIPKVKMYAKDVYGAMKKSLTKPLDDDSILVHNLKKSNYLGVSENMENDLEKAVFKLNPRLLNLKERLKTLGARGVMVSGSGPCVFGLVDSKKQAENMRDVLSKRYAQVFVAKTL